MTTGGMCRGMGAAIRGGDFKGVGVIWKRHHFQKQNYRVDLKKKWVKNRQKLMHDYKEFTERRQEVKELKELRFIYDGW